VLISADGQIAGEGYHERKGEAHAEAQALQAAGELARGATAVVTLEPCNHAGRTPACRRALIDAGVRRVVIALADPTSRGEGGTAALRAAGVEVETGVLTEEAHAVLGPWLAATQARRPVTIWPYVITEDGIMPLDSAMGELQLLRMNADAVLAGDGAVGEGVPGSHGRGMLQLPKRIAAAEASEAARLLFDGGVRTLILDGGYSLAGPFLTARIIDHVVAFLPDGKASRRPRLVAPWPLLPPGFSINKVGRIDGFVRVHASTRPRLPADRAGRTAARRPGRPGQPLAMSLLITRATA